MKILFNGCSWAEGAELENPEEERYSRLVCNELGADEKNIAKGGGSNDRIIRTLTLNDKLSEYDLIVIQMTLPARTEYWDEDWKRINPKFNFSKYVYQKEGRIDNLESKFRTHAHFWRYYYTCVTNKTYFDFKEKIQYRTIQSICKAVNVPLILCTINQWTKLKFDLQMEVNGLEKHRYGHPTKKSHQLIANEILKIWNRIR